MAPLFYSLGLKHAMEKMALLESLKPATQGMIKRVGQGAAVGMVPGALTGYAVSDEHPVLGTLGGAATGAALGGIAGHGVGKEMEQFLREKLIDPKVRFAANTQFGPQVAEQATKAITELQRSGIPGLIQRGRSIAEGKW